MKAILALLTACALLLPTAHAESAPAGMVPMSETEMQDVNGRQGLLLDINVRNNVSASNTPIGCTVAVGTPNPCRMGLEFAARDGTWLMLKEYYGTLEINDLRMDAAFLPAANTTYYDSTRFLATNGITCLVPGCNPNSDPTIKLTYPGLDTQSTYNDFLSFLNIGRTWLEFDTAGPPALSGYQRDTSLNSVLGVRMSDSTSLNASAHMRFLGTAYVYGF